MLYGLFYIIDILAWCLIFGSIAYVLFFAIASLFGSKQTTPPNSDGHKRSFLVLFPAYNEDKVIIRSAAEFCKQQYPKDKYDVAVISDHMKEETNAILKGMPITLHQPIFEKSSKAKALMYAIDNCEHQYDNVVILDADNIVAPDFLALLNDILDASSYDAIQCHRCAKNSDNEIAILDGISEEINNTIFRKGHNAIGLSSALIGSGMCFSYKWFAENVKKLNTAGEDRELEAMLLEQDKFIKYEENILVYDEKVSNQENFQKQRLRWMTAQVQSLITMLPNIPKAIKTGNINYIDKTIQQALIPRSILIVITIFISLLTTIISPISSIKWWSILMLLCIAIFIATPAKHRKLSILNCITYLPRLTWKMLCNIIKIDKNNKDFIHTTHDK